MHTDTHTLLAIGILNVQFVSDPLMVTRSEAHVVPLTVPAFITTMQEPCDLSDLCTQAPKEDRSTAKEWVEGVKERRI